jgi:hypothetical protein
MVEVVLMRTNGRGGEDGPSVPRRMGFAGLARCSMTGTVLHGIPRFISFYACKIITDPVRYTRLRYSLVSQTHHLSFFLFFPTYRFLHSVIAYAKI